MRILSALLCLLLAACAAPPAPRITTAAAEAAIDPAIAAATVLIERTDKRKGHCTGVLVARDVVATAAHCLEDKPVSVLQVFVAGETMRPVLEIVGQGAVVTAAKRNRSSTIGEAKRDWLLIRIAPVKASPVEIDVPSSAEVAAVSKARGILVPGYSGKSLRLVSPCYLRQQIGSGQVADLFGMSCDVKGGDSGAPVFLLTDAGPRLIGVVKASANSEGISYAVSTNQFAHLVRP